MLTGSESSTPVIGTVNDSVRKSSEAVLKSSRQMVKSTLGDEHQHCTANGQRIQIWSREGKYIARARYGGQQVGVTLGSDKKNANRQLQRMLIEFEDGTFVPRNEARRRQITHRPIPKLKLRGLASEFLSAKRKLRGIDTGNDYQNRLMHVLDFAELPLSLKTWPLARDLNSEFALALRGFLYVRDVTPNGRDGAESRKMSPKMVRACLETLRAALNWAVRADVRNLPPEFMNPITHELLGPKQNKDPLRACHITMPHRVAMVDQMDEWHLLHLTPLLLLPTRFEDVAGALVSDIDLQAATWRLGARCGGSDFNKGRVEVQMPLPPVLIGLLRHTIDGRTDGPLFRERKVWNKHIGTKQPFANRQGFESLCNGNRSRAGEQ